ncbi:WD40 repeat-like protein [Amylocystis lapponica]|nr:WD40 repeat-like protein [Amylocystis lapponica]
MERRPNAESLPEPTDLTSRDIMTNADDYHAFSTTGDRLRKIGVDEFNKFQRRGTTLDHELRHLSQAARQLGGSVGILSSSFQLRERLAQVLFLLRDNAANLFPHKGFSSREALMVPGLHQQGRKRKRYKAHTHVVRPRTVEDLDPEDLPYVLEMFARDVTTLLDCLDEFPVFTQETVTASLRLLEGDLKYWASCLKAHEGKFRDLAVQKYSNDISSEMGEHFDSVTSALGVFIEIGVPAIRFSQEHASRNLLNLSTVATFFSAVTATTMQFSYTMTGGGTAVAVNSFWFTSLVFSIGAAVNSLLGLTWKQAMYRSPGNRVPWWVLIWIKRSPLVFLVLSVMCFSMGLVLFAYASGQHMITSTLTTVFSAFSCFGLAAVSMWFASERWVFFRNEGQKLLADVILETQACMMPVSGISWLVYEIRPLLATVSQWSRQQFRGASNLLSRVSSRIMRRSSTMDQSMEMLEENSTGSHALDTTPEPTSPLPIHTTDVGPLLPISEVRNPTAVSTEASNTNTTMSRPDTGTTLDAEAPAPKRRFVNAVGSVMKLLEASRPAKTQRRIAAVVPKLRDLTMTQHLPAHRALVKHMQFSPDGKFLATSSWDRTSVIFQVGHTFESYRVLAHPHGYVGQVAWSPSGKMLLTQLQRAVEVWTEDGIRKKSIVRQQNVQSIAWLPSGEGFMIIEGSAVLKLDLNGKVLETAQFDQTLLYDVAVTSDCERMLCVGRLTVSKDGLQPSKSRGEKQIIVYNLNKKTIEVRVPVLDDIRVISLSQDDKLALVSYHKASPQLWKLDVAEDTVCLSLDNTYMPEMPTEFAGPSYFGGKSDQLVVSAGKAGDIYVWDRRSAVLLHHIRGQDLAGSYLTCVAWNSAAESFMFAAGTYDGAVRIWTIPIAPDPVNDMSSGKVTTT